MKILDASNKTGLSTHMIRYYEKIGLINPIRLANGYRNYSESDIFSIILVKQYNNLGIELKTIKQIFKNNDLSIGLNDLNQYISSLQDEALWINNRIENAKELSEIILDLKNNNYFKIKEHVNIYFYNNSHTKEYSEIVSKTNSIKYCFRIKNEVFNADFPNDIGIIANQKIPHTKLIFDMYLNVKILRTFTNVEHGRLLDKNDLHKIIKKIQKLNHEIIGDCFIYQVYNNNNPINNIDTICLEFIIK